MVKERIKESVAPSTSRVYSSAQKKYLTFCNDIKAIPLPLNEQQLCRFVVFLDDSHLQHSTIKGYLSALRRFQIVQGMGDPFVSSWAFIGVCSEGH